MMEILNETEKNYSKKDLEEVEAFLSGLKLRAVFQILSLGAIFLIPDLIFTIGRILSDFD